MERTPEFDKALADCIPVLNRIARKMATKRDIADDLVQSTLLKAILLIDKFEGENLPAWLAAILRFQYYEYFRFYKRTSSYESIVNSCPAKDSQAARDYVTLMSQSSRANQEDHLALLEAYEVMEKEFPAKMRDSLYLACVLGESLIDVSSTLDIPIGTLKSRISRGRVMLAQWLDIDYTPRYEKANKGVRKRKQVAEPVLPCVE